MTMLVIVVAVTILVSAACSLFEAVLYSTNKASVEAEASIRGDSVSRRFIELKENISVPIAAILILNTVSNTGGASVAGMYAGEAFGPSHMALFSVAFTFAILFLSEIMPKTVGAIHWRSLWPLIVWPLLVLNYALYPAIYVARKFAAVFARASTLPSVTEDEILATVRIGAKEGEITQRESRIVHNIIALENQPIRTIMTPRTVMFSLDADLTVAEAVKATDEKGFTRIPVFEGDRENIIGYVLIHDLLSSKTRSRPEAPLRSIAKPLKFVPQTTDALSLFTTAVKQRTHIYIAVDEYGGVAGVITLEDLIETMIGDEIVDETDRTVDLQELARRRGKQRPTE